MRTPTVRGSDPRLAHVPRAGGPMRRVLRTLSVGSIVLLGVVGERIASADAPAGVEIAFRDATVEAGLDGVAGDRFSWADFDGDGDPDLLVNGTRLFRNDTVRKAGQKPAVRFTDVTASAGTDKGRGESGIFVDMDGDGRLDVVTTGGALLLQGKDGKFSDVSAAWGLELKRPAPAVGAGDVDGDGYPDLLFGGGEDTKDGQFVFAERRFFRNVGGKRLSDETSRHDLKEARYGRAVVFADYDRDGDLDAYVGNYRLSPNELLVNDGGVLRDRAKEAGVEGRYDPEAVLDPTTNQRFGPRYGHTIGASWADLDGDGDLDLFVPNLAHKFVGQTEQDGKPAFDMRGYLCDDSAIYRNEGGPAWTFTDVRPDSGIAPKPVGGPDAFQGDELWSNAACGDVDGDGLPEVYVAQVYDLDYSYSLLFHNDGDMKFTDVSEKAGTRRYDSYGGAFADVDGDGDVDLVVGGKPDPQGKPTMRLLMNETPPGSLRRVPTEGQEAQPRGARRAGGRRDRQGPSRATGRVRDGKPRAGERARLPLRPARPDGEGGVGPLAGQRDPGGEGEVHGRGRRRLSRGRRGPRRLDPRPAGRRRGGVRGLGGPRGSGRVDVVVRRLGFGRVVRRCADGQGRGHLLRPRGRVSRPPDEQGTRPRARSAHPIRGLAPGEVASGRTRCRGAASVLAGWRAVLKAGPLDA